MAFKIGLAGPANVGKSTTARRLLEEFDKIEKNCATAYAFAEPIYEMVKSITGIPIYILKSQDYKNVEWTEKTAPLPSLKGWTPRKFLQKIGTECFRDQIFEDFWIEYAIKNVNGFDIAIFEDARFENEFKKCDIVIELEREGVVYAMNHPSAMPPDPKYVTMKINLTENLNYKELCYNILQNMGKTNAL